MDPEPSSSKSSWSHRYRTAAGAVKAMDNKQLSETIFCLVTRALMYTGVTYGNITRKNMERKGYWGIITFFYDKVLEGYLQWIVLTEKLPDKQWRTAAI
jgi:hypothetical protein